MSIWVDEVHGPIAGAVGLAALNGEVTEASWRTKPIWYLVATDDRIIPAAAQRLMSKRAGARLIEQALWLTGR